MNKKDVIIAAAAMLSAAGGFLVLTRDKTTDSDDTGQLVLSSGAVAVPQGAVGLGARAVEVLSRHLGEHGMGAKGTSGYHRGPFVDQVNRGVYGDGANLLGKPWCARAVRWGFETGAQELGLLPPFAAIKSKLSSVSDWKKSPFKDYVITEPKTGAVLLLGDEHATIVAQAIGGRDVITVEGNHGDAMANVRRTIKPGDTLVDVEALVRGASKTTMGGLHLFGI